ncbi:MAG TPA: hypothetical protein VGX92_10145 [Pyrinomonadaceae bacterium]|jgi:L-cystine uptake protein TcyP (sodium:dicarboxylate symporter family)|nr:hypothetical protein [Pyrinomonadaceae bacterium]
MNINAGNDAPLKNPARNDRRDIAISLVVLALIIILALSRIALDENWRKVLRVSMAFLTYNAVLLALVRHVVRTGPCAPFWIFAAAAASAELASGWLRVSWRASDLALAPLAALLIGGVHWLALRAWRSVLERIEVGPNARSRSAV